MFGLARTVCKQAGQMSSSHVKLAGPRAGHAHNWADTNLYRHSLTLPRPSTLAAAASLPFSDTFTAVNALKVFAFLSSLSVHCPLPLPPLLTKGLPASLDLPLPSFPTPFLPLFPCSSPHSCCLHCRLWHVDFLLCRSVALWLRFQFL